MPIAQGFLAEAGVTDYKFLPVGEGSVDNQLAWVYGDGTLATLTIMRPEAKVIVTTVLAMTIEADARPCKGQYSSGYMPARYHLGSEIRKAYTACADGANSFANYYSVLALASGAIVRFGAGATQSNASPEAMPRADRLENAALRPTRKK
jgi:hypothetical protein